MTGDIPKDDTEASPPAKEPDDPGKGLVAPEGGAQSDLVLKRIHELLNDPAAAKDLEQREGYSRSDLEQFAKKFEKKQSAPPGPGREIKVTPGEQTATQPSPNLPGLDAKQGFSTKTKTDRGSMPQDQVQNNLEDLRFQPPPEFRNKYAEFKNQLGKVLAPKRAAPASKKSGQ